MFFGRLMSDDIGWQHFKPDLRRARSKNFSRMDPIRGQKNQQIKILEGARRKSGLKCCHPNKPYRYFVYGMPYRYFEILRWIWNFFRNKIWNLKFFTKIYFLCHAMQCCLWHAILLLRNFLCVRTLWIWNHFGKKFNFEKFTLKKFHLQKKKITLEKKIQLWKKIYFCVMQCCHAMLSCNVDKPYFRAT